MRLIETHVIPRPDGRHRLTGIVEYADNSREDYWFELPFEYLPSLSGNPWLAILLPLAATLGEDLEIDLPVDPSLLLGVDAVMRLWRKWYPKMHLVQVRVPHVEPVHARPTDVASFFSAGVDSTFTVLRRPDATTWITVHGFDMPLANAEAFEQHQIRLARIANDYGKRFVAVATNIRETRWRHAHWEAVSHGPALTAVGLLFESYFGEILIPSSYDYDSLDPWGSHPLLDTQYSTLRTKFVHDGVALSRTEKIGYLAEHERAMRELHVCYRGADSKGQDHQNCSRCEKCYRTMIALDLFGKLDDAILFDRKKFEMDRVRKIYISHVLDDKFFISLSRTAAEAKRFDVVEAIEFARRRSRRIKRLELLTRMPVLWRAGIALQKRLLRDAPR
ncbi:hypothetical protein QPK31_15175 [Massilia sp. YIM B02769]|uniref:hypothetical protein n=1 Tax=Massilia sp. YIM B02769 TaxID=3050129 RepID=UPI0025B6C045|nr:hypothetical protein [Massilia sp. YIM B02769]MDN4059567.1 hypothetical protein [Massilia sp. YIM B02769]